MSTIPPPEPPPFDPVPTAFRHDGWTPETQARFIAALTELGTVAAACKAVRMTRNSAYRLRRQPGAGSFAEAWDIALEMCRDWILDRVKHIARNGYTRPVHYRGKLVGHRRVYDNRLAYALAYGERPFDPYKQFNLSLSRITSSPSDKDT